MQWSVSKDPNALTDSVVDDVYHRAHQEHIKAWSSFAGKSAESSSEKDKKARE